MEWGAGEPRSQGTALLFVIAVMPEKGRAILDRSDGA